MPSAFDAVSSSFDRIVTPASWTHTPVGTPTGVVVKVCWRKVAGGDTVNSVTYGGTAMVFHGRIEAGGLNVALEYWKLANPAAGAQTVEVTFSAAAEEADLIATTYTGTRIVTADLLGALATATGNDTDPTVTGIVSATDDLVDEAVGVNGNRTITEGGGQTMRAENSGFAVSSQHDTEPGAASVTASWTFVTTAIWVCAGASVVQAAAAANLPYQPWMQRGPVVAQ